MTKAKPISLTELEKLADSHDVKVTIRSMVIKPNAPVMVTLGGMTIKPKKRDQ